jgi:hypothetical protein
MPQKAKRHSFGFFQIQNILSTQKGFSVLLCNLWQQRLIKYTTESKETQFWFFSNSKHSFNSKGIFCASVQSIATMTNKICHRKQRDTVLDNLQENLDKNFICYYPKIKSKLF